MASTVIPGIPHENRNKNMPMVDANESAGHQAALIVASQTISADEVALYDRQIRLWGMEAQTRMRNSKILLITMRGLANEVAKNLVLAGIGSLTVLDHEVAVEDDLGSQFFISEEDIGMNRAVAAAPAIEKLNPRVPIHVDSENIQNKPAEYFKDFDIVIATDLDIDTLLKINEATRECGIPMYSAATFGLYGYIFADLIEHEFVIKRDQSNRGTILGPETRTRSVVGSKLTKEGEKHLEFCTKLEKYVPLSEALVSKIDSSFRLRKKRAVPAVLPGVKALWKFQQKNFRLPTTSREDFGQFTALITEAVEDLGLQPDLLKAEFIRSFMENATAELSPVSAVLGGILAQDAINILAKLEQPIQNILIFDGDSSVCPIYVLAPESDD